MTIKETAKVLYMLAEHADARFSETCRSRGFKSRWDKGIMAHPEIREAYRAKVNADEAWLTFLRTNR